jgi:hypothetical protein
MVGAFWGQRRCRRSPRGWAAPFDRARSSRVQGSPASASRRPAEGGGGSVANRAQTLISFAADLPSFWIEQEKIIAATSVLRDGAARFAGEDLGQTYTVSVGSSQSLPMRGDGYVAVQFGARRRTSAR